MGSNRMARWIGFLFTLALFGASLDARGDANLLVDGGFESGTSFWTESSTGGFAIITQDASNAHSGNGYAYLGDYAAAHDLVYQQVTIPADVSGAKLRFWYNITTFETNTEIALDQMAIVITDPDSGSVLATIASFSNLNSTNGWLLSPELDLSAFRGRTIRVNFVATNDDNSDTTTAFLIDDVSLIAGFDPNASRLINISTRMQVLTGGDVVIGGFVIGGGSPKKVAVLAKGPSLTQFGINNALPNPMMQLVRITDGQTIAVNDDWGNAPNAGEILQSGFAPSNSLESAVLMTLDPGAYTAIISGVNNSTGVGIVEVYEVDSPFTPLINISTRGRVGTGNDVMIGGFAITGSAMTVVVTAKGPSLAPFGIANPLPDPQLTLVRISDGATIAFNDNWQSAANAGELQASGFAPSNPLESAILITLDPGLYTAIVSGVNNTTGTGIVEVFAR
jgi:hypothetical protein